MRIQISKTIFALAIAISGISTTGSCAREGRGATVENTNPKVHAEKLANSYGRSLGAEFRAFNDRNFVSFGEVSFRFDATRNLLIGYVFVTPADIEDLTPSEMDYQASFLRALNDPEIGGMFENGGSVWILDRSLKGFFMTYEFPLATTTRKKIQNKINELIELSGPWVIDWWMEVGAILDGEKPKPTRRVTRADRR